MVVRKPLDLPPDVARSFVQDMRAYFAEDNPIKRDGIARAAASRPQGARRAAREKIQAVRCKSDVFRDEADLWQAAPVNGRTARTRSKIRWCRIGCVRMGTLSRAVVIWAFRTMEHAMKEQIFS